MRPLFPADMRRQKAMLLGALVLLRKSLRVLDPIVPKLHELGARHVAYGARPEHYPIVGSALLAAMSTCRRRLDGRDRGRLEHALGIVSGAMLVGAEDSRLEAAA